jgi:hypothetical protein
MVPASMRTEVWDARALEVLFGECTEMCPPEWVVVFRALAKRQSNRYLNFATFRHLVITFTRRPSFTKCQWALTSPHIVQLSTLRYRIDFAGLHSLHIVDLFTSECTHILSSPSILSISRSQPSSSFTAHTPPAPARNFTSPAADAVTRAADRTGELWELSSWTEIQAGYTEGSGDGQTLSKAMRTSALLLRGLRPFESAACDNPMDVGEHGAGGAGGAGTVVPFWKKRWRAWLHRFRASPRVYAGSGHEGSH